MVRRSPAPALYLATLALLPWGTLPPFPWLHENAQGSDALFALAATFWVADLARRKAWPRLGVAHVGMAVYLGWAALSLALAHPRPEAGLPKLMGMAMLVVLALMTADMVARPGMPRAITWTVTVTSLLAVGAALLGLALAHGGHPTRLVGTWGDLVPGPYVRPQAAFVHPSLLASYCLFASGVVAWGGRALPMRLRRLTQFALALTVVLTLSRALFGFVLAGLVRHARTPTRRRLARTYALGAVVLLALLTVFALSLDPAHPSRTHVEDKPGTRLGTFVTAWATFESRPLFGTGPGGRPGWRLGEPFEAHFTPLNIAATLGFPALVGFLLVPFALWRGRNRPTDLALWGMLAGLGLDALASDIEDFRHLWVAFGLAAGGPARPEAGSGEGEAGFPHETSHEGDRQTRHV